MRVRGVQRVKSIIKSCEDTLTTLEELGKAPNEKRICSRLYSVEEAAEMVGRNRTTLLRAAEKGVVSPEKFKTSNKTKGYTLEEVNKLWDHFGTRPNAGKNRKALIVAVQSFKGGVSKSVTSVYLSEYLAQRGYKVLLVDCDPQASATSTLGFMPDRCFTENDTMLPFFENRKKDLRYAIIPTYFPGISIIPSCLPFYEAEFKLAFGAAEADSPHSKRQYFHEISQGLSELRDEFDIILIDSPPALGMITINIIVAADAIIVPTPPSLYDFSSTVQYFKMICEVMEKIAPEKEYDFIKILATKANLTRKNQKELYEIMQDNFTKTSMFDKEFKLINDLDKISTIFQTLYDLKKPSADCLAKLDSVFSQIEESIVEAWETREEESVKSKEEVSI